MIVLTSFDRYNSPVNPGDPEGKRIARRQADLTEEACRFAECTARLMRRAGESDEIARNLAQQLRIRAVSLREKADGRVESRLTTRLAGHPLLENRQVNTLFLDESGSPVMTSNDTVFALGRVAMKDEDVPDYIQAADSIKQEFFGTTDVTFHEPHMRKGRGVFSFRRNEAKHTEFLSKIRELVDSTPFTTFGVSIRKQPLFDEFTKDSADPYLPTKMYDLAIMLLMERYVDYLATNGAERRIGRVHLESIGSKEDAEHQAAYADLLLHGTQFVPQSTFQSWVETGCRFSPKSGSNPAELADLVARDIFEWTVSECQTDPPYWASVSSKTYCRGDGNYGRFGIKVFPSSDIQDRIIAHRLKYGTTL